MGRYSSLSPEYKRTLIQGLVLILIIFLLAGLVLDHGLTAQITLMAALGYLGAVTVIAMRRPQTPTRIDILLIRWGFIPLWFAAQYLVREAWTWMGRL